MNPSPVNIDTTFKTHLSPLDTHYIDGPITLINNGHTIQTRLKATTADNIKINGTYTSAVPFSCPERIPHPR
jgi:carbonic anhydrase